MTYDSRLKTIALGAIRRRYEIGLAAVLGTAVYLLTRDAARAWMGFDHDSFNGAHYSIIARNYLDYGLLKTKFGMVLNYFPAAPEQFGFYSHHPPLLPLAVAFSFGIFGEYEWAARLVPILSSVFSVALVYLIGRELWSSRAGLIASAAFMANPAFIVYGKMVDHEALVAFFVLAAVFSYVRWARGSAPYIWPLSGALVLGGLSGWPAYYLLPVLSLHYLVCVREKSFKALIPLGAAAGTLTLTYLQIRWMGPQAYASLIDAFRVRTDTNTSAPTRITLGLLLPEQLRRMRELFTPLMTNLSFFGLAASAAGPHKGRGRLFSFGILAGLFLFGATHVLLFQHGAMYHSYWIYYFLPALALSLGVLLDTLGSLLPGAVALAPALVALAVMANSTAPVVTAMRQYSYTEMNVVGGYVRDITKPGEIVLAVPPFVAAGPPSFRFYAERRIIDRITSKEKLEGAVKASPAAAVLVAPGEETDPAFADYLRKTYPYEEKAGYLFFKLERR